MRRDALLVALLEMALERLGPEAAESMSHDVGVEYGRTLAGTVGAGDSSPSLKAAMESIAGHLDRARLRRPRRRARPRTVRRLGQLPLRHRRPASPGAVRRRPRTHLGHARRPRRRAPQRDLDVTRPWRRRLSRYRLTILSRDAVARTSAGRARRDRQRVDGHVHRVMEIPEGVLDRHRTCTSSSPLGADAGTHCCVQCTHHLQLTLTRQRRRRERRTALEAVGALSSSLVESKYACTSDVARRVRRREDLVDGDRRSAGRCSSVTITLDAKRSARLGPDRSGVRADGT